MKKRVMSAAIVAIFFSFMAYGTGAFFTAEEKAHNVITTGGVDIAIEEWQEVNGKLKPFENVEGVMPGKEVSKIVQIKNTGASDAYIRVAVNKEILLASGNSEAIDLSLIKLQLNTEDWTEHEDGFYYYNDVLKAGDTTAPLFTSVTFDKSMGNLYQNCTVNINVQAQATQVANNGANVFEAKGWPEN